MFTCSRKIASENNFLFNKRISTISILLSYRVKTKNSNIFNRNHIWILLFVGLQICEKWLSSPFYNLIDGKIAYSKNYHYSKNSATRSSACLRISTGNKKRKKIKVLTVEIWISINESRTGILFWRVCSTFVVTFCEQRSTTSAHHWISFCGNCRESSELFDFHEILSDVKPRWRTTVQ